MPPLFKDGATTFEQALDLVRRREFDRASSKFRDAAEKFRDEGRIQSVDVAIACSDLVSIGIRTSQPAVLSGVSSFLRGRLGTTEIQLGARGISAAELANQMDLSARDRSLVAATSSPGGNHEPLAKALQLLAEDYRRVGSQVLYLSELFDQRAITTDSRVPVLMALSYETLGVSIELTNPLAAAEHFQTAQQYWLQAGEGARAQANATRVGNLAFQARCWFCGREGTGHGIQFVSLPVGDGLVGLKDSSNSPLPSIDGPGRNIFACKGCFSATQSLADRIAVQRMIELEGRIQEQLRALEARLYARLAAR